VQFAQRQNQRARRPLVHSNGPLGGQAPVLASGPGRWALTQQRNNSFIKQVMEQVKKDMEADPKLKKDWEKVQKSSQRMAERGQTVEERLSDLGESFKSASSKTSSVLGSWKESASTNFSKASEKVNAATESNETFKKAHEFLKSKSSGASATSSTATNKVKGAFGKVMDSSSKVFSYIGDEDKKGEKTKKWKEGRDYMRTAQEAADDAKVKAEEAAAAGETAEDKTKPPAPEPETALVVSERHSSSWDRFGSGLRDMPFLSSVFDNPVFDRVFGESEIAASIREMREVDSAFFLEEFTEDMEYIVAPHIIGNFLTGNQDELERHCGEAAFASVNASIKARVSQKLSLDPTILAGPKELQLVSAKLNENGPPSFIWTFQMQQVNCLRDHTDEIIEGAVDDIRTVCYAMAVHRHPSIDKDLHLEYPWQVSELAILWNQPCF